MKVVSKIESHSHHCGVHAAGILVCNDPITSYAGINCRDNKRIAMLDKKDAEEVNLLKIDALGLRTLSILAAVCDQIGKHYSSSNNRRSRSEGFYFNIHLRLSKNLFKKSSSYPIDQIF